MMHHTKWHLFHNSEFGEKNCTCHVRKSRETRDLNSKLAHQ